MQSSQITSIFISRHLRNEPVSDASHTARCIRELERCRSGSAFCVTILVGICIGFVLPPLATHSHYAHKGYSLYNEVLCIGSSS
ncbi:MAG: DUF1576 domain-containing protein [Clostridia bacterium]